MSPLTLTAAQTVGPFFAIGLTRENRPDSLGNVMAGPATEGQRIRLEGRVLDGDGEPVPDAMLELWQANAHGRYNHPADERDVPLDASFSGFGRVGTDDDGSYWFETIKPGRVPGPNGEAQSPHLVLTIFARGLLNHAVTRVYFADEPDLERDPILRLVPPARRSTLLARPIEQDGRPVYRLDVVLQGPAETAFLQL
ncbi:MAG: protocatechuate 3,4-dioxygenase subunit alpha [Chloroflexota bacterium]|nr:protocatechuate 3,4-dioxygenase subunit alpha [Chloroflexota bacterium]